MFKCEISQEFGHRERRLGGVEKNITLPFVPYEGLVLHIGKHFSYKITDVLYSVDDNDFTVIIENEEYPGSYTENEAKRLFERDSNLLVDDGFSLEQ